MSFQSILHALLASASALPELECAGVESINTTHSRVPISQTFHSSTTFRESKQLRKYASAMRIVAMIGSLGIPHGGSISTHGNHCFIMHRDCLRKAPFLCRSVVGTPPKSGGDLPGCCMRWYFSSPIPMDPAFWTRIELHMASHGKVSPFARPYPR